MTRQQRRSRARIRTREGKPNWGPRTLFHGDNLNVMRNMNSNSVDLIYLDPPFNTNRIFAAPMGSKSAGQSFEDMWGLTPQDEAWLEMIRPQYPAVAAVAEVAASTCRSKKQSMKSYLAFMAVRLIEMYRILKPTGCLYLHCDPHANSYLRLMLDAIFGRNNVRNEIVRERTRSGKSSQHGPKGYARNSDTIFFCTKSDDYFFAPYEAMSQDVLAQKFPKFDARGRRYALRSLERGRTLGDRPNLCYEWRGFKNRYSSGWALSKARMEEEYAKGNIVIRPDGKLERRQYAHDSKGSYISNIWLDHWHVPKDEKTDWQTQKPLKLLARILNASSRPGDIVFDPFCGCATACVAAELLERHWIGIDIDDEAQNVVFERLEKAAAKYEAIDGGILKKLVLRKYETGRRVPNRFCRDDQGQHLTPREAKDYIWDRFKDQGGRCLPCYRKVDFDFIEVDHIIPESFGGNTVAENLQPLCRKCNGIKNDRPMEFLLERRSDIRKKVAAQRFD